MAMSSANPPVAEMRRLIDTHGAGRVARALIGTVASGLLGAAARRRANPRRAVPDSLRTDVGLPPPELEMRRYWEVR